MNLRNGTRWTAVAFSILALGATQALAQHHDTPQPKQPDSAGAKDERAGEPYPFDTCPISGKKLGEMGDPLVKKYEGREVRFCCEGCPPKFEKDLAGSLAKLDEKIVKDQGPLYPLKTSLVTGKDLPEKPYEFVWGNRLIRLGADAEKADFLKDTKKYFGQLNEAVVAEQIKDYPLKTCPSSGEELGAMGDPRDVVLAGRLIRLCCGSCKKDLEESPAKFIAIVDTARKGGDADPESGEGDHHKGGDGAKPHKDR